MKTTTPEMFKRRVDELWSQHQRFLVKTIRPTDLDPASAALLDEQAKEMIASVDDLRLQVDTLDVRGEQRTVWHGSLSAFQIGVASYISKRGRHAEACTLARGFRGHHT